MPDNKPSRRFFAIDLLIAKITAGMGGVWGAVLGFFLRHIFNKLAAEGIYFIDITSSVIRTNMDEDTWLKTVNDSYEKVEQGNLTDEQGVAIDRAFIAAFNNFTVFKRVKRS